MINFSPFRNAESEAEKACAEQFLLQEQRSFFSSVYRTAVDLILNSHVFEVQ